MSVEPRGVVGDGSPTGAAVRLWPCACAEINTRHCPVHGQGDCFEAVLGYCPHGVNLDRDFCPEGCRV